MSRGREAAVKLVAGLAVATFFLLLLEGALRLFPLDRWERDRPNTSYPLFVPGTGTLSDQYVTNPHFAKTMSSQRFARVKPPGVKRVFILGGSAPLGWPGPIEAAFTGYLQRALNQVAPGRFEIINAAAMSYGSHRVLDLLADIVRLEPDLIVIWSGSNEYVERNTLSRFARTEVMGRVQRVLRHSSLYRSVRLALGAVAPNLFVRPEGEDITDPRHTPEVRRGIFGRSVETDRQVLENYRVNLQAMARLIRESGAEGVFCTVPVNLAAWVPSNQPPSLADPARQKQWSTLNEEVFSLGEAGRYAEAVAVLDRQLEIVPEDALGQYLLGHVYLQLGRKEDARAAFSLARDFDLRPIRALSTFQQAIRRVAASEGMTLVDLEEAFASAAVTGVPGLDLFLDYVHPNEAGHKLAAATVLQGTVKYLDPSLPLPRLSQLIAGDVLPPGKDSNRADSFYTLGLTLTNNGDIDGAEQAYLRSLEEDPSSEAAGNLGVIYDERGDLAKAREFFQLAVRLDPSTIHSANLARVRFLLGDRIGAREMMQHFLRQGIVDVELFKMLGQIESADGRYPQALDLYLKAVAAGDASPALQAQIGDLYRKLGDETNAQKAYARAGAAR